MKKYLIILLLFLFSSCCKNKKDLIPELYNPLSNTTWYRVYRLSSPPEIYEDKFTFTKDSLIIEYFSYEDSLAFYNQDEFEYCWTNREYLIKNDNTLDINSGLMQFKFIYYGDSMLYGVIKESEIMIYKNRILKFIND